MLFSLETLPAISSGVVPQWPGVTRLSGPVRPGDEGREKQRVMDKVIAFIGNILGVLVIFG